MLSGDIPLSDCVHCLLCRPNHPPPSPVYDEYECYDSKPGDVVFENMTKNPSYATTDEAVTCFTSGAEVDNEREDHIYEELPFEANDEEQRGTIQGGLHTILEDTAAGGHDVATGDARVKVNQ